MSDEPSAQRPSGPAAFWRSLPGVLTGIAAVIAAVVSLATLFKGGDGGGGGERASSTPSAAAPAAPADDTTSVAAASGDVSSADEEAAAAASAGCFGRVFAGIPRGRLAPVEAGTDAFDIVGPSEPQAGPVGLRFTDHGRTVGGVKVTWIPVNEIFRVDAVVDGRCRAVSDFAPVVGTGQKNVMHASDGLRMRLTGGSYLLRLDGGTMVRVGFLQGAQ